MDTTTAPEPPIVAAGPVEAIAPADPAAGVVLHTADRRVVELALGDGVHYTGGVDAEGRPDGEGCTAFTAGDTTVRFAGPFVAGLRHGWGSLEVSRPRTALAPASGMVATTLSCGWQRDVPQLCDPCVLAEDEVRAAVGGGKGRRRAQWTYSGLVAMISSEGLGPLGFAGLRWALRTKFVPDAVGERLDIVLQERYCGEWQCGLQHGFGFVTALGTHSVLYCGLFDNGARHGTGTSYDPSTGTVFDGVWCDGSVAGGSGTLCDARHPAVTLHGQRWSSPTTVAQGAVARKAADAGSGVWEPLFAGFDEALPAVAADIDDMATAMAATDGGPAGALDRTALIVRHTLTLPVVRSVLAAFQRCAFFLFGSCDGARGECGAGPTAAEAGPAPRGSSWCALSSRGAQCPHRGRLGRPVTPKVLEECMAHVAAMAVSVRLRLMGFALGPEEAEREAGAVALGVCGEAPSRLLHGVWDAVLSAAAPVAFGVAARCTQPQAAALAASASRHIRSAARAACGAGSAPVCPDPLAVALLAQWAPTAPAVVGLSAVDPEAFLPAAVCAEASPAAVVRAVARRLQHALGAPPAVSRCEGTAVGPLYVHDWARPADAGAGHERARGFGGMLVQRVRYVAEAALCVHRLAAACTAPGECLRRTRATLMRAVVVLAADSDAGAAALVAWLHVLRRVTRCDAAARAAADGAPASDSDEDAPLSAAHIAVESGGAAGSEALLPLSPLGHWALLALAAAVAHTCHLPPGGHRSALELELLAHTAVADAPGHGRTASASAPVLMDPAAALEEAHHPEVALAAGALFQGPAAARLGLSTLLVRGSGGTRPCATEDAPYVAALDYCFRRVARSDAAEHRVVVAGPGAPASAAVRDHYTSTAAAEARLAPVLSLARSCGCAATAEVTAAADPDPEGLVLVLRCGVPGPGGPPPTAMEELLRRWRRFRARVVQL